MRSESTLRAGETGRARYRRGGSARFRALYAQVSLAVATRVFQ
jgi:hypothetical protein